MAGALAPSAVPVRSMQVRALQSVCASLSVPYLVEFGHDINSLLSIDRAGRDSRNTTTDERKLPDRFNSDNAVELASSAWLHTMSEKMTAVLCALAPRMKRPKLRKADTLGSSLTGR